MILFQSIGALTGFDTAGFSKAFAFLGQGATFIFWGLLGLGILYIFVYYLRFNVPLYMFMERGKGIALIKDRGKIDKKKKKFSALKYKDIDFPYPESKFEYQAGKKAALCAFVKNQSATWMTISDNPNFVPANYNMQRQMIGDFESTWNIVKPKEKFWDKYGQQILWVGSIGVFLLVIILILKRMDRIIELGRSAAEATVAVSRQTIEVLIPASLSREKCEK